jgi:hypothetical protein
MEIIDEVLPHIHFAINEQCHKNNECAGYQKLTKAGLTVFNIEYGFAGACKTFRGVLR